MTQQVVRMASSAKGYDATEPFPVRLLCSSAGMGWRDVQLNVFDTGAAPDWNRLENAGQPVITLLMSDYLCLHTKQGHREVRHESRRGTSLILPAGEATEVRWTEPYIAGHLHVSSEALRRTCAETFEADPDRTHLVEGMTTPDDLLFYGIASALMRELNSGCANNLIYVETLSQTLLVHLLRHYTRQAVAAPCLRSRLPQISLQRVRDYVADNLACNMSLTELAAQAGLSPFHLTRLFKRETGHSLHQYIIHQRVAHAKHLLLTSDAPLKDIAMQTGFADQSHLTRHFRRVFGQTPHEVRKNVIGMHTIVLDAK